MTNKPDALVSMRLKDMTRRHPDQDDSHVCSQCGEALGLYPTGQRALALNPRLVLVCVPCAAADFDLNDVNVAAGSLHEILREIRESRRVR